MPNTTNGATLLQGHVLLTMGLILLFPCNVLHTANSKQRLQTDYKGNGAQGIGGIPVLSISHQNLATIPGING